MVLSMGRPGRSPPSVYRWDVLAYWYAPPMFSQRSSWTRYPVNLPSQQIGRVLDRLNMATTKEG